MKNHSRIVLVMTLALSMSGCTIISHLDELQTMGAYSRDKNVQHAMIEQVNKSYDALVLVLKTEKIKDYPNTTAVLRNFGEPIARKKLDSNIERWLYRHAIPQKAKDKVYLYFDMQGNLIKFEQEQIL